MNPFTILRLTPSDLRTALRLMSTFSTGMSSETALIDFLGDPANILLAAVAADQPEAGQALGMLVGYILPRWERENPMQFLYSIEVLASHRRLGIAAALIGEFLAIGRRAGCFKAFVLTDGGNTAAMRLYTATGATRPHRDDVLFVWEAQTEEGNPVQPAD